MPHHASAKKRLRSDARKRRENRIKRNACFSAIKQVRRKKVVEDPKTLNKISAMLDTLAKRGIIHKNKSARLKSKMGKHLKVA